MNRRSFVNLCAGAGAATLVNPLNYADPAQSATNQPIRAVAFDAFVLFDHRSIATRVEQLLPGKGEAFATIWRTRQFEYTWLRTLGNRYQDFSMITREALGYAATSMKLSLSETQRKSLLDIYLTLPVWPDVPQALEELHGMGIRLACLSDFTAATLDANLAANSLSHFFQPHLTTDRVRAFKPSPSAYQMGMDNFRLSRQQITFAAFGAWDAAGAKWFGYPTVWVNRANVPLEQLDATPDLITPNIGGLLAFIRKRNA